ncbi:tripartite tricarboxylate transporter substrate binding protein [Ramlibacter ginsenosidimutans]|uniref:Tripartite tricarboxylate transporter substrate binding protein n=1 Tax=Ramlibacter ginsenosidimutans TaxID=502333 RepID=A0A934TSF6_9BURK|nr:tripartite tricarboxylate transporter substrate binding protein [Ramlibacter ginsenosidimutans]MBK6005917.1 tripartite tricarboxylate transporter substrate binding protein [Ramlibacter ginsenosidimutans]
MNTIRRSFLAAAAATLLAAAPVLARADTYPSKPIRVIVPFAPGGASDFVARILAPRLQAELGQTILIDNRAGAAGNIGMEMAAQAAPDGYTAFLGNVGTLAINPAIFGKSQRVTAVDFAPVSLVVNAPDIMVANPAVPGKTVAEFVEHAHKTPGMSFASPGSGSLNRLEMELFRQEAKLDMTHVPYKGGAGPAITDVVGGHVPVMFVPVPAAMQLVKAGRLKPIAVASAQRLTTLPEVPTLAESGYPKVVGGSWQAVMFPKDTPPAVIARWHEVLLKVLARDDVKADLLKGGVETMTSASPKELADFIQEEARRWGTVAKASNATAD